MGGLSGRPPKHAFQEPRQGGAPVYMYRWDYRSNQPIPGADRTIRAGHATDILAKFENTDFRGMSGTAPDRFQAARSFGECWTAFARAGRPSVTGAPTWPASDLNTRATLLIDVSCTLANDPDGPEREVWQATVPKPG